MENIILYCKIYELKGMISSLQEMANEEQEYSLNMIDSIYDKMNEVIKIIETNNA